jgi:hypothetical protein
MALDITGKIVQIMNATNGTSKAGKEWTKQEFVIETQEQYPRKVMMSVMGDKVQELKKFSVGMDIKASLNIESREYNTKWYTDIRAWKIEGMGQQASSSSPQDNFYPDQDPTVASDGASDDLPF